MVDLEKRYSIGTALSASLSAHAKSELLTREGRLYAADTQSSCLILHRPPSTMDPQVTAVPGSCRDFVCINLQSIQSIQPSTVEPPTSVMDPLDHVQQALQPLNMDRLLHRERQAIRQWEEAMARIGEGVTAEAQAIFDALSKTLPCRWRQKEMLVMDEVVIRPPYTEADCQSKDQRSLAHVQKVVSFNSWREFYFVCIQFLLKIMKF